MAFIAADESIEGMNEDVWREVIAAVDRTYSELVDYQERLEAQNRELDEMRRFMASVLASVSELLIVVDPHLQIEQTGGAIKSILGLAHAPEAGTSLAEMLGSLPHGILAHAISQVMVEQKPRVVEMEFTTSSGATPLEVSVSPRLDSRGRSQGAVIVGRPLGELRNAYGQS